MKDNQKEWNLLLQTCKAGLTESIERSNDFVDFQNIDWHVFKRMAQYHKVRPLIYKGITKLNVNNEFPKSYINELGDHSKRIAFRNFDNTKELIRLGKLFDKEEIDFIPYKGVILSQLAYGDIGIRESSDIDILIKLYDFEKIQRLLLNEGYTEELAIPRWLKGPYFRLYCEYNFDLYNPSGRRIFHVEPHWYTGSKMFQTDIAYDQIVNLTNHNNVFGQKFKVLSPEGLLITTAIHHGYSDRWNYLKNVADIAAIINASQPTMDWELIITTCDEFKLTNLLISGIILAKDCFNISVPNVIKTRIERKHNAYVQSRMNNQYINCKIHGGYENYVIRIMYQLKLRKHFFTKLLIIYYHMIHILLKPFIKNIRPSNT